MIVLIVRSHRQRRHSMMDNCSHWK